MQKTTLLLLVKLFALSFGILFFVSPDSYTHDIFRHVDPAWFFSCGKAWMNGLTPYVDFADSKGPLLWLIYGIGYLISPYNYIGVFWLSVLLYTGVFYYTYRLTQLFIKDNRLSFFVITLMVLSFFCSWFHREVRAEDWCQLFIVMAFFYSSQWLYAEDGDKQQQCNLACFVLGICIAGTLLIKFTITAMLGFVVCYILYAIIRQRYNAFFPFLNFVTGFVMVTAPFCIYMLFTGCFEAFIQEYFLNTFQTVQSDSFIKIYCHEWLLMTHQPQILVLFLLCGIGTFLMSRIMKKDKWFFLVSFIGFYAVSLHHYIYYYLSSCLLFPLFFIIPVVLERLPSERQRIIITGLSLCFTIFMNSFSHGFISDEWFFKNSTDRTGYYKVASLMSVIKNPTVVHYGTSDHGLGLPVGVLPGTKYWSYQTGATPEMKKGQEDAIMKKQTDFVVNGSFYPGIEERDTFIRGCGYRLILEHKFWDGNYMIYTKHQHLSIPDTSFHVSSMDILLKRNLFKK
jgi:hypothetical protein